MQLPACTCAAPQYSSDRRVECRVEHRDAKQQPAIDSNTLQWSWPGWWLGRQEHCNAALQQCTAAADAGHAVFALLPVSAWQHSSERSLVTLMPDANVFVASACHHLVELNPCREVEGAGIPARGARVSAKASVT